MMNKKNLRKGKIASEEEAAITLQTVEELSSIVEDLHAASRRSETIFMYICVR